MMSGGERDITAPTVCVVLLLLVFAEQACHAIMLMRVNFLFLPTLGTVALLRLLTLCL